MERTSFPNWKGRWRSWRCGFLVIRWWLLDGEVGGPAFARLRRGKRRLEIGGRMSEEGRWGYFGEGAGREAGSFPYKGAGKDRPLTNNK